MARLVSGLGWSLGFACCVLASVASAQTKPAYSASDIERHFSEAKDLGPSRALCIGADSECAKSAPSRPKISSGFDLIVNFDYNSDTLTPGARANLDEFAKALRGAQLGHSGFMIEGHTDAKGGEAFNMDLSSRRAQAVTRYLAERGVDAGRLEAKAFGKSKPRASDPSDPVNRRVEARIRED
ncbi:outer membrane protein OmpA-like peptidoglycan-associated protein [Methylobacterium sp. BE186]|nr:outer membrane protein OmpA-like peptidoglycan-associated protein [Methylobacterium sp. BE186]